jgi:PAS domain S-box-containing protein
MGKKVYKLNDIEKYLSYVPPFFILILAILSIVASYFIMEYREKSHIKLLVQEQKFVSQNHLNNYVSTVNLQTKKLLNDVEKELKRSVYTLKGIYTGVYLDDNKTHTNRLAYYINEIEKNNNVNFVIFDKNLHVLHGLPIVENIQELIFSQKDNKTLFDITLLYIQSQGAGSSMSWKNDLTETIQLSYFETGPDNQIFIGAFSRVDSLKNLTVRAFISSIKEDLYKPKDFYFWLYDSGQQRIYNLKNQKQWKTAENIEEESISKDLKKYFLTVGISRDKQEDYQKLSNEIKKTEEEYRDKKNLNFAIIFFVSLVLITVTTLFSGFIKRIFASFNKRFESKNRQITRLKERYELAVIASNDGLWDTNFKTNKTFFSRKWLTMLGYKIGDIKSYDDWFKLLHPDDQALINIALCEHTSNKKSEHLILEYRIKTKEGPYKWILGRGKVFMDEKGTPERLLMMSMDIDEKKEASKKLQTLVKQEVAKNQAKERILIQQNKLAAMGEMIGAIAHQWRQPLNNISLIIHFIRDNVKNKKFIDEMLNDYVDRAKKQITYMSETIDDFQDFYKPSKNKVIFDVKEAIYETLSIMQTQIDKYEIEVNVKGNSHPINGYENEFKQAILNILANAKDAIALKKKNNPLFKGQIIISLEANHSITIYNNGGIARDEVIERMFEPYFTTKFEDKGTGIGLYMTKTIIENNMNGKIYAQNRGDGMMFTIEGIK